MASGNGSPGTSPVVVYLRLPPELLFIVDLYANRKRCASTNEAFRRLLESHPDLTILLNEVYNERDTSPQPNMEIG